MSKRDDDGPVYDAKTGVQIGGEGNVIVLNAWRSPKPMPIPEDDPLALAERLTISAELPAGMTADEVCDLVADAELAALPERIAQMQSDEEGHDDDI